MARVAIEEDILVWAIHRSGLDVTDFEHRFPKIHEWITGACQPTLRQLELLAKATLTPLGFFFLKTPPEETFPIPHFRTLSDNGMYAPSPDLLETIQTMQQRQTWMRDFLIEQGQDKLDFVGSVQKHHAPTSVVKKIRRILGLKEHWASEHQTWAKALRTLRETMEAVGILIVVNGVVGNNTRRKLDPGEFRGFVLVDDYCPSVFVNGTDGKAAQMFTLAHELAHVFLGSSAAFDLRNMEPAQDDTEQACNRIAAEFLIPESELRHVWPSIRNNEDPFQKLARRFKVSALVAARRAVDLHLIDRAGFMAFYEDYQNDERRKAGKPSGGGDFYANQNFRVGQRFASAVIHEAREGKLLYSDAYRLTGLYGNTFDRYAASLGFGSAD